MENLLVMLNRCISSKNFEEMRSVHSVSDNVEIFMGTDTDEVIEVNRNII